MTTIDELVAVTLVWDATLGSPAELQPQGGKVVLLPPEMFPLAPRGTLLGMGGFSRQDGAGGWQWVLQGEVDPVSAFVDTLTGLGKWVNPTAKQAVVTMIGQLWSAGIPRATIAVRFPQLYAAIAAELASERSAAGQ